MLLLNMLARLATVALLFRTCSTTSAVGQPHVTTDADIWSSSYESEDAVGQPHVTTDADIWSSSYESEEDFTPIGLTIMLLSICASLFVVTVILIIIICGLFIWMRRLSVRLEALLN